MPPSYWPLLGLCILQHWSPLWCTDWIRTRSGGQDNQEQHSNHRTLRSVLLPLWVTNDRVGIVGLSESAEELICTLHCLTTKSSANFCFPFYLSFSLFSYHTYSDNQINVYIPLVFLICNYNNPNTFILTNKTILHVIYILLAF